jgi:hypothetical protein
MTKNVIDELKNDKESIEAKINSLHKELQEKSKKLMHECFKEFFIKYGDVVENIFWTAYTPFFNDGEACEFSVHDAFILLKDDEDACDYEGSSLYSEDDIVNLKSKIADIEAWEKDPMAAARKHQAEYMKRYNRDPFSYDGGRYGNNKTPEEKMAEWKPHYATKETYQEELKTAEYILSKYPNLKVDFEEIKRMINGLDEDLMKAMFGDHVKVVVSVNGIEVEEYDHD